MVKTMVCFVYCLRNKVRASREEVRWFMHFKVRTPCSHGRGAWENSKANPTLSLPLGRGCEIQPNGGVDFGKAVHLRVLSNSTVPLPFGGRRCKIQLNGVVHLSWGYQPNGTVDMGSEGWEWCPTQRSRSLCNWGVDLEGCPIATQRCRWVGEKGFINPTQKNNFFGLLSKLNICL